MVKGIALFVVSRSCDKGFPSEGGVYLDFGLLHGMCYMYISFDPLFGV